MATQKQIEANRENARKSTGPRTEAGKAASSANALKHGLTAADSVVLPEEDAENFEQFREGVTADLAPAGALQHALAHRIAVLLWRLDRVARLEAELFAHGQLAMLRSRADETLSRGTLLSRLAELPEELTEARVGLKQFNDKIDVDMCAQAPCAQVLVERRENARAFDQIGRHEAMLQRSLNRTLDEFRRLRDAAGTPARTSAPPPARTADPDPAPPAEADPEPEPSSDVRPPAPSGSRPPVVGACAGAGRDGEEGFSQNEANSAQTIESAPGSAAEMNPSTAPPAA